MILAAVHAISYPVLVWLVWVWLGIAESSALALAGSAALGVVIVVAVAWLLATAFEGDLRVSATWARSLLLVVIALCLAGVKLWLAGVIAALLPALLVRRWGVLINWRYWAACVALVIAGGYVPWKVITWVPAAKTLTTQATSMAVRFGLAYLISVAALLVFASAVRRLAIRHEPNPAA